MRWESLVFSTGHFTKLKFSFTQGNVLEMPDSFFIFFHIFLFLCGPLIISEALHQPWVLNTCSTKVLLHFFSHACPFPHWMNPDTFHCCPVPFGPRNYAHSWLVILDTKKQHMCVMNTTKHVASYQSIIHPKCDGSQAQMYLGITQIFLQKIWIRLKADSKKECI
jgi:hypothetical protein